MNNESEKPIAAFIPSPLSRVFIIIGGTLLFIDGIPALTVKLRNM